MSIPKIDAYRLPGPDELPVAKAPWTPVPKRAALLVHDMQDYFLDFYDTARSPVPEMLRNIDSLREQCTKAGIPVVLTTQPSDPERAARGLLNDLWGPGLPARPELAGIVSELRPRSSDHVLCKTRYSAFHGTELLSILRAEGRDQLWICGVYGHIGCMLTASDAFMNDVKPFLVADAIADFSRGKHDMALDFVAGRCGSVQPTRAVLDAFAAVDTANVDDLRRLLKEELAHLGLEADAIADEDELRDHGLDSVRLLELSERLYERGFPVSMMDMMECDTFALLHRYLDEVHADA